MKKTLSVMLSAALLAGTLVGCGAPKTEEGSSEKVTISVSQYPPESDPEGRKLYDEKIQRFEEKYPNIDVVGDPYDYKTDTFIAKAASGQLPTFYLTWFSEAKKVIAAGYAQDLTDVFEEKKYDESINENIKDLISKDGKFYAIPSDGYMEGLMINIPLFKEAGLVNEDGSVKIPKTYDEMRDFAVQIKEKTGQSGFALPTTQNCGGWKFMNIAWSFGTKFMEQDADGKWKATFDSPECAAALQYVKDLKWKHNVLPTNTFVDFPELQKQFGTGQLAMMITTEKNFKGYIDTYGMSKDDIAMVSLPEGPEGKCALTGGNVWMVAPNATKEQKDACMKWAEFNGYCPEVNDDVKNQWKVDYENDAQQGYVVGCRPMEIWNSPEREAAVKEIIDPLVNVDMKNFEDYINSAKVSDIRVEEPVACQELYKTFDACIQQVLTEENADVAEILKKANADFQQNYLDNAE